MTVVEIRFCDPSYIVETRGTEEGTFSCGISPTIVGWFSRPDWQRGFDIVVIDPVAQELPGFGR